MSRTGDRLTYGPEVRISLLETDMDDVDKAMDRLATELKSTRTVLIGILISLATASLLLAVNVGIGAI